MKQIFLASSFPEVAGDIVKHIEDNRRKLVFITTAAEAEEGDKDWLQDNKIILSAVGFSVAEYTLTGKTERDVRKDLNSFDVIAFSGGNTFYLLEKIQQSNTRDFFREQIEKGVIYIGSSAGSLIAGPDIEIAKGVDPVKKAPQLKGFAGLNLVDFTVLPHWGNEYFKEAYLKKEMAIAYGMDQKIILLNDNQYIYVKDDWYKIVSV